MAIQWGIVISEKEMLAHPAHRIICSILCDPGDGLMKLLNILPQPGTVVTTTWYLPNDLTECFTIETKTQFVSENRTVASPAIN